MVIVAINNLLQRGRQRSKERSPPTRCQALDKLCRINVTPADHTVHTDKYDDSGISLSSWTAGDVEVTRNVCSSNQQ